MCYANFVVWMSELDLEGDLMAETGGLSGRASEASTKVDEISL